MDLGALKRSSRLVLLGSALLFLVVLFLDWHRTSVVVVAEGEAQAGSSGWSGWGLLAGICALAIVGLELDRVLRKRPHEGQVLVDLALSVGVLLATVAAIFTGDASISAGAPGVEVGTTLGPAWLGLALAGTTFVAALLTALPDGKVEARRPTLT